jgi:DNA-binding response OmpR family regulator
VRLSEHLRAQRRAAPAQAEAPSRPRESYSLLVAGDRSIAAGLKLQGHRVGHEASADLILERLNREHADALIVDLRLSEVDGFELCRRLRARGNRLPVLLLLPKLAPSSAVDGFEAGADGCLVGPFSLEELIARLHALLRRTSPAGKQGLGSKRPVMATSRRRQHRDERRCGVPGRRPQGIPSLAADGAAPERDDGLSAIRTAGLTKDYGPRRAIDGLTIDVPMGTVVGFVGPKGTVQQLRP